VVLTFQGKLLTFVSRFFPRLADRIAAKRVRALYKDEIEAREAGNLEQAAQLARQHREATADH
jgi:hypothetical protein